MQQMTLSAGWRLKQRDPALDLDEEWASVDGWLPARVPGTVHEALLDAGLIPDPFYGLNEKAVQWVGEQDWLYRCDFEVSPAFIAEGPVTLCCDGLDTVAMVWLNGKQVLATDNMFLPRRVSVTEHLQPGGNVLVILFVSALRCGKDREAQWGRRAAWNGDPSRVYVRKAQYHYGWDWGPCLLTAGPWRAVRLEAGADRIAEVHCPVEVASDLERAVIPVTLSVEVDAAAGGLARAVDLRLIDPSGTVADRVRLHVSEGGEVRHSFVVDRPELWWPNGHGSQPLYHIQATLTRGEAVLDRSDRRLGIRRLRLLQEPITGEPGSSFAFEVNNVPIFCGGANWIPADSFTTRLGPHDYRVQLEQAAAAHMVMLRVWGGGIYEEDAFYDQCDELGLMVWQDFMFACGMYPGHAEFQESVRDEAEAQVRRLRHHPCLVLWCGNNEDYEIAESLNAYHPEDSGDSDEARFPARAIYEQLLPAVCERLDPARPYWPGSPYGGRPAGDQTVGDRHAWDIWHRAMAPYRDYPRYAGRFVSEFGMQSCPAPETIASVLPPEERYSQSRTMDYHNKASDGPRRLAVYLNDTLRVDDTIEDYIYATQFVQSEALAGAYRGWRRRWSGPGQYRVAGALVWQLNDCWPVTSWAIVDYARRLKPAYHAVRRELAPLVVGVVQGDGGTEVWAVNATARTIEATLHLQAYDLDGERLFSHSSAALLGPNQATELGTYAMAEEPAVVGARLLAGDEVLARATAWPEPFKYLTLADPDITVERCGNDELRIQAVRPAKGLWLMAGDGVTWSDNMLDLLPGDPQIVTAQGLHGNRIDARWLGGHESTAVVDRAAR